MSLLQREREALETARRELAGYALAIDRGDGEVTYERARRAGVVADLEARVAAGELLTARERVRARLWLYGGRYAADLIADFDIAIEEARNAG